jgi:uracil-DNA glycosylase family 4
MKRTGTRKHNGMFYPCRFDLNFICVHLRSSAVNSSCAFPRGRYARCMGDAYSDLVEATIQHLEGLKARGVRFVAVSHDALAALTPLNRAAVKPRPARPTPIQSVAAQAARPSAATKPAALTRAVDQPLALGLSDEMVAVPSAPALSPDAKAAAFTELRQRALACVKCSHLASSRQNVVFGVGNIDAQLMFVGEAPGADEDTQGEPFVGKAGQLLTRIIETMGLSRESVYIANILKCRPDTPGQSAGNRKPTPEEMQTCIPFLHEQIDLIRPKVLVALGGTAVEGLLGKTIGITRLRGQWQTYRGTPLMPTYHPAFLLRNQDLITKRCVWEDMLKVMEKLGMPISEKQQGFFLKS